MVGLLRKLVLFFLLIIALVQAEEEQVKWTPNEDADNAPLPLSMKQRQQLLRLQQTIESSDNPNAILQQVAEANGMSPQELVNMLNKNVRDLQQDPSLLQPRTITSVLFKILATLFAAISGMAKKHPNSFALSVAMLVFILYATITIPRTGMRVSRSTTLFSPNQKYLKKLADSPNLERRPLSIKTKKTKWDDLKLDTDGSQIHKLPRKAELVQAVSAQLTITPHSLLEEFEIIEDDDGEKDDESGQDSMKDDIMDLLFTNAATLLAERQLAGFSPSENTKKQPLKIATSNRHKLGVLVVPGLGMFRRFGLVHWQTTHQLETDKDSSVTLTTLKDAPFSGQIHCQARKYKSKIVITVHLVVPKGGRKIRKAVATKIVNEVVQSMGEAMTLKTRQTLARRYQGKRFKNASHRRAKERRQSRFEKEKEIEEMAEDRRRRWQRNNPDAGRYRPSGHRQKSPNNC